MRKCRYLRELGIHYGKTDDSDGYGWADRDPTRKQRRQRRKYGFDSRECYNLDDEFILWLYAHLRMYLDDADRLVKLDDENVLFHVPYVRIEEHGTVRMEVLDLDSAKRSGPITTRMDDVRCVRVVKGMDDITQKACIERMIDYIRRIYRHADEEVADESGKECLGIAGEYENAVLEIWKQVFRYMWW